MGKIAKKIKLMFPINWENMLKEHKIIYKKEYNYFLIRLSNLFEKYKILYRTSLRKFF